MAVTVHRNLRMLRLIIFLAIFLQSFALRLSARLKPSMQTIKPNNSARPAVSEKNCLCTSACYENATAASKAGKGSEWGWCRVSKECDVPSDQMGAGALGGILGGMKWDPLEMGRMPGLRWDWCSLQQQTQPPLAQYQDFLKKKVMCKCTNKESWTMKGQRKKDWSVAVDERHQRYRQFHEDTVKHRFAIELTDEGRSIGGRSRTHCIQDCAVACCDRWYGEKLKADQISDKDKRPRVMELDGFENCKYYVEGHFRSERFTQEELVEKGVLVQSELEGKDSSCGRHRCYDDEEGNTLKWQKITGCPNDAKSHTSSSDKYWDKFEKGAMKVAEYLPDPGPEGGGRGILGGLGNIQPPPINPLAILGAVGRM